MIELRDVHKRFRRDSAQPWSLKDLLLLRGGPPPGPWVLHGIDLDIGAGEAVGLVGKNGCGKTTLLRLIAGILRPDRGRVSCAGRIAPLLGLGAGFHPDLTGAENIALNGALLGIGRAELRRCSGAIAEFSGLGEQLGRPLRFYSSGMQMRLGFAIAVHVEPEVLLIDEVLAVGDASFQERCRDRIRALRAGGTTLLLVSHAMDEVAEFCERVVWLDRGAVGASGPPDRVIEAYLASYCA